MGVTMEQNIPVVVLCGGLGTRLAEETEVRPKPMIEIGEQPILWHIMKHYSGQGFKEFVVALGYKGDVIKRFFFDRATLQGDVTIKMQSHEVTLRNQSAEDWIVHLVDTGVETNTGGRIGRLRDYLDDEPFM